MCEFRFDTDLANKYITIHRQSSRDEGNAREAYGKYIIKNANEESTEYTEEFTDYMDPAKFNYKMNVSLQFVEQLHIEPTSEVNNANAEININFEGAPHEADWKNGKMMVRQRKQPSASIWALPTPVWACERTAELRSLQVIKEIA